MPDAGKSAEKTLVGIKGWLLLYLIGPGFIGTALRIMDVIVGGPPYDGGYLYFYGMLLTATVVGLYLIIYVREKITQTFQIWLHIIWAGFWAYVSATLLSWPTGWGMVIGFSFWAAYWIGSKRVRATYCQDAGQIA